jgi:hypothetical protein
MPILALSRRATSEFCDSTGQTPRPIETLYTPNIGRGKRSGTVRDQLSGLARLAVRGWYCFVALWLTTTKSMACGSLGPCAQGLYRQGEISTAERGTRQVMQQKRRRAGHSCRVGSQTKSEGHRRVPCQLIRHHPCSPGLLASLVTYRRPLPPPIPPTLVI